jgi:hypothetical protein
MRTSLITIIIIILPLFVKAQNYNLPSPQFNQTPFFMHGDDRPPQLVKLPTLKPISRNRIENAEAKLVLKEQKLTKMARNTWDKEADLKAKQEELKNLENTAENNNNPDHQKKIEKCKKKIAKSQDEVDKAKVKLELESKKVEAFEKSIEEAKQTRQES